MQTAKHPGENQKDTKPRQALFKERRFRFCFRSMRSTKYAGMKALSHCQWRYWIRTRPLPCKGKCALPLLIARNPQIVKTPPAARSLRPACCCPTAGSALLHASVKTPDLAPPPACCCARSGGPTKPGDGSELPESRLLPAAGFLRRWSTLHLPSVASLRPVALIVAFPGLMARPAAGELSLVLPLINTLTD